MRVLPPPPSEDLWMIPLLISCFPIDSDVLPLPEGGFDWLLVDFECLLFVRIPLTGYDGYYRPAIRIQWRLLLSLLLYQIPRLSLKFY